MENKSDYSAKAEVAKRLRADAGVSQDEAADYVRVSRRTWQSYERAEREMPDSIVELFCIKFALRINNYVSYSPKFPMNPREPILKEAALIACVERLDAELKQLKKHLDI